MPWQGGIKGKNKSIKWPLAHGSAHLVVVRVQWDRIALSCELAFETVWAKRKKKHNTSSTTAAVQDARQHSRMLGTELRRDYLS
jgi:hypothetical protein